MKLDKLSPTVDTEGNFMKNQGNTILVTGGGSGIGRALAQRWHDLGNRVIVAGRRQDALDATIAGRDGASLNRSHKPFRRGNSRPPSYVPKT